MHADISGALWWPARRVLVVADLHLEKGSSLAAHGALLPPYDSSATVQRLADAIDRLAPDCVICLGDSFHDGGGPGRLDEQSRLRLTALAAARDWVWIAGNHDPSPSGLGGRTLAGIAIGGLVFRHEAVAGPVAGEVSGHFHPKARVATRARSITARCFASDDRRIILPAFGAYAGGLNVLDPAIARFFPRTFTAAVIGRDRVHVVSAAQLLPSIRTDLQDRAVGGR
ncbi:MAG: ligase-associated DNA damage response endonuclease PdeM [Alphaproteobacteria bacterium]|nr:ligase-associated DNA damage response endonuclease PdeM [Alphaproteobacteria bacterium]